MEDFQNELLKDLGKTKEEMAAYSEGFMRGMETEAARNIKVTALFEALTDLLDDRYEFREENQ